MWKFVFGVLVGIALYHEWVWAYLEDQPEQAPDDIDLLQFGQPWHETFEWDERCQSVNIENDRCTRQRFHAGEHYYAGIMDPNVAEHWS